MLPYIVVLDWDGTIAGKVDYQCYRHTLKQCYKQYNIKYKKTNEIPLAFYPNSNLIRKGLVSFIKDLQKHYNNNIYFFIYTASEKVWANTEIKWVEETHGISFQRPIFTRDDCINYSGFCKKSIDKIFPRMIRSIKVPLTKEQKMEVLNKRLLIIDNNQVYVDMQEKVLLCPDYDFMVFENISEDVNDYTFNVPYINELITLLIKQGLMCPLFPVQNDINYTTYKRYSWLVSKCKEITESNKQYINDSFFKNLKKLIIKNNIKAFTPNVVKQLHKILWKTYTSNIS